MKLFKFVNLVMLALAFTFVATGCRRNPKGVTQIPARSGGNPDNLPPGGMVPGGDIPGGGQTPGSDGGIPMGQPGHVGWNKDTTTFEANMVHFAYDSSVVRSEDKSKIAAVADHLKAHASAAVEVEGHCDERGTDEYNRSLGDRRALAVREELVALGIEASRVDTISYGRNRPIDNSNTEEGRSRNRRGVFVLLTPP